MDDIMRLVQAFATPSLGIGGLVGLYVYFRKYDREMRDEMRADYGRIREEQKELYEKLGHKDAEIERLKLELWEMRKNDGNPRH